MINFPTSSSGTISKKQSTFLEIEIQGIDYRINYIGKVEFSLESDAFESILIEESHPLLLNYSSSWSSIYIHKNPKEQNQEIEAKVTELVFEHFSGWRAPQSFLNETMGFRMLKESMGLFFHAPIGLSKKVDSLLCDYGIGTSTIESKDKNKDLKVLLLDQSYVIAKDFKITSNKAG